MNDEQAERIVSALERIADRMENIAYGLTGGEPVPDTARVERVMKRLEAQGLVERRRDGKPALTAAGQARAERLREGKA